MEKKWSIIKVNSSLFYLFFVDFTVEDDWKMMVFVLRKNAHVKKNKSFLQK